VCDYDEWVRSGWRASVGTFLGEQSGVFELRMRWDEGQFALGTGIYLWEQFGNRLSKPANAFRETVKKVKQTGSYTLIFASGKRYRGKGGTDRSETSARRIEKETGDTHVATDWTKAETHRKAFKQEAQRIREDGGVDNPNNYNKINSPGERYSKVDGI
jgi:hypothetical protein